MKMRKRGFTLTELLVTIAILAVLATVSIVGYVTFINDANRSNLEVEAHQIEKLIESALVEEGSTVELREGLILTRIDEGFKRVYESADKHSSLSEEIEALGGGIFLVGGGIGAQVEQILYIDNGLTYYLFENTVSDEMRIIYLSIHERWNDGMYMSISAFFAESEKESWGSMSGFKTKKEGIYEIAIPKFANYISFQNSPTMYGMHLSSWPQTDALKIPAIKNLFTVTGGESDTSWTYVGEWSIMR